MNLFPLTLIVVALVSLSAIFSGLNIALMSLSKRELQHKAALGDARAQRVLPLRANSHLSLASILFANVAVVSANALVLEDHFSGLIAGLLSTLLIVIFGEVLPQAIFVKSALSFVSFFTPLIWFTTIITYPVSKPLQLILDKVVGHESHPLHSRAELGMLISEHKVGGESELDEDEVGVIEGALQLSEKTVKNIMRPIEEVYWLRQDSILDAKTVDEITQKGYSRIPIFDAELSRCYGVLLMKDMVDIDFDDNPLPVTHFPLHKTRAVGSRTALDTMLKKLTVIRSHLIPVEQNDKIIGIVTAEDLLEEVIGQEISDETDHKLERI